MTHLRVDRLLNQRFQLGVKKPIPADSVDDAFVSRLVEFMRKMTSPMPPRRVPGLAECGWCALTKADGSDRVDSDVA